MYTYMYMRGPLNFFSFSRNCTSPLPPPTLSPSLPCVYNVGSKRNVPWWALPARQVRETFEWYTYTGATFRTSYAHRTQILCVTCASNPRIRRKCCVHLPRNKGCYFWTPLYTAIQLTLILIAKEVRNKISNTTTRCINTSRSLSREPTKQLIARIARPIRGRELFTARGNWR
jgi:hypothetical protein